jgi:hypothetical protein
VRFGLLEEQTELGPARWVQESLRTFAVNVASIIPERFAAYARLFHPAYRREGATMVPVRWSEVAASTGRTAHQEMQWEGISGVPLYVNPPAGAAWDIEPEVGSLPRDLIERLVELVRLHTNTPEKVWFASWNGWGSHRLDSDSSHQMLRRGLHLRLPRRHENTVTAPTFDLPGRCYYLLAGPIEGALESMAIEPGWRSANLWWPDDRAWFVSTEIDFAWTYVGGSRALIDQVLTDPELEAHPAEPHHRVAYDSDRLNPPPEAAH